MKPVLVLGSNSFSGASYCAHLKNSGIDVIATSRSPEPHQAFLPYAWLPSGGNLTFQKIDLNHDLDALESLIRKERLSYIVNFAAQSMVGESWNRPEDWMTTNVTTVAKLIERLRHIDFLDKYVHVTTPEVYGSTDGWINESQPFNPTTPYAVSRAAGDMIANIYHKAHGLPVVMTRAANVFGPGQRLYRIIPRTILFIRMGRRIELHGGGSSQRSFIHMSDVSRATELLRTGGAAGSSYHISTNRIITIRDLVRMICEKMGVVYDDHVTVVGERLGKDAAYYLDSAKIRTDLEWQDSISLETGIENTIEWVDKWIDDLQTLPLNYVHKP